MDYLVFRVICVISPLHRCRSYKVEWIIGLTTSPQQPCILPNFASVSVLLFCLSSQNRNSISTLANHCPLWPQKAASCSSQRNAQVLLGGSGVCGNATFYYVSMALTLTRIVGPILWSPNFKKTRKNSKECSQMANALRISERSQILYRIVCRKS